MNSVAKYELKAEAFRLETGMLAPGKDSPAALNGPSFEEREAAWTAWQSKHGASFDLFIQALGDPTPERATEIRTATYVGALMVCYDYATRDGQMVQGAAREGGLFPMGDADRAILRRTIGEERTAEFEAICKRGHAPAQD